MYDILHIKFTIKWFNLCRQVNFFLCKHWENSLPPLWYILTYTYVPLIWLVIILLCLQVNSILGTSTRVKFYKHAHSHCPWVSQSNVSESLSTPAHLVPPPTSASQSYNNKAVTHSASEHLSTDLKFHILLSFILTTWQ